MLSPKEIAQHDGIGVLGSEYLSTSCVKGKFNKNRYIYQILQFLLIPIGHCTTPQEKDFKDDLYKYFLEASSHWKNC